jgi:hypothetical protein
MAKVPLVVPPFPSETAYVITGSVPEYPRTGVNVNVPSAFTITVPTFGISTILPAGYVDAVRIFSPANPKPPEAVGYLKKQSVWDE